MIIHSKNDSKIIRGVEKKLQAEVGDVKRSSCLYLFNFAFPKEKAVGSYENDYIGHYRRNGVLSFRVMADSLWKYKIGGKKYELWHIYDN